MSDYEPIAPLVSKVQLSELAAAVDAENNAVPDPHAIGMMAIAMFRLQHIYERDRSRRAWREKNLREQMQVDVAECEGLAQENDMLFDRAAGRLARIKELEAHIVELVADEQRAHLAASIGSRDRLIGRLSRQLDAAQARIAELDAIVAAMIKGK